MLKQKILIIIGAIAGLWLVIVLALLLWPKIQIPDTPSVSPNILFLTSPVTNFSGTVDSVSGNTVTVSQTYSLQPFQAGAAPMVAERPDAPISPMPTPISKKLTYRVTVGSNTQINRPPIMVNYLFLTPSPTPVSKLTISDIKKGQMITIGSNVDLRTLTDNQFEAVNIQLPPIVNTLNGRIVAVSGNSLTVKSSTAAVPIAESVAEDKEYKITVTDSTEISRYKPMTGTPDPSKPAPPMPEKEKLSLSDLKKDMQVTVWTDDDVTTVPSLTALRIEPFIISPPAPAAPKDITPEEITPKEDSPKEATNTPSI